MLALAATGGCKGDKPVVELLDPAVVAVGADRVLITGSVGHDQWEATATYVLVEAKNTTGKDAMITLGGELVDAGGQPVSPLRRESLRVPAGGGRVFALVDDGKQPRPEATDARVTVASVFHAEHPAHIVVTDGTVFDDFGRAVVGGYVVNQSNATANAVVLAAFFDEAGRPMKRPSTMFNLDPGQKRGMQLVGPPGSRSASLFIGEVGY